MRLHVLRKGSSRALAARACCGNPFTFGDWAKKEGETLPTSTGPSSGRSVGADGSKQSR